jgi:hypothetical protein
MKEWTNFIRVMMLLYVQRHPLSPSAWEQCDWLSSASEFDRSGM